MLPCPEGPYKNSICVLIQKVRSQKLLLQCAQELCDQVTTNEEMQQFLANPPFTTRDVQIIIYSHDKTGRRVHDPEIGTAEISRGVFTYRTWDHGDTLKFKNEYKEAYEEAVQTIRNEELLNQ